MNESLLQIRELVFGVSFVPVAAVVLLLSTAGAGLWRGRWKRLAWALSLTAVLCAFFLGVLPHAQRGQEWKEVLFNGQLL